MSTLQSTARLKDILADYFQDLQRAHTTREAPIAWCTSVGPSELLIALGFRVYYPENHGAMLGALRLANDYMPRAHARGYSPDACSYLASDVGAHLAGETPLRRYGLESVPRPDVLVFNTNQCRDVRDWFEFYGREWNVPVIGVTSMRGIDEITDSMTDAIAQQLEGLVPTLESVADRRLDAAELEAAVGRSLELSRLWNACLGTAAHRPAPFSFFDGTVQMAPAVVMRATEARVRLLP